MPTPLAALLDRADFVSLSLCRTGSEWQASLEVSKGSFRIRVASTPSEALGELFGQERPSLPPLPY